MTPADPSFVCAAESPQSPMISETSCFSETCTLKGGLIAPHPTVATKSVGETEEVCDDSEETLGTEPQVKS